MMGCKARSEISTTNRRQAQTRWRLVDVISREDLFQKNKTSKLDRTNISNFGQENDFDMNVDRKMMNQGT